MQEVKKPINIYPDGRAWDGYNDYDGYDGRGWQRPAKKKEDAIASIEKLQEDTEMAYSLYPMDAEERALVRETLEDMGLNDDECNSRIIARLNKFYYTTDHIMYFSTPLRELIVEEYETSMHIIDEKILTIFNTESYDYADTNDDDAPSEHTES